MEVRSSPRGFAVASLLALTVVGCRAEIWVEEPGGRRSATVDSVMVAPTASDTVFRAMRVDSVAASFAWLLQPRPRVPRTRSFPDTPVEAVRQYVRALGQTGSSELGEVGVGEIGYERAFTYLHPRIRRETDLESWTRRLEGVIRPTIVTLRAVPGDTTRVFTELSVLREIGGQSLLGLYYGHFTTASGDNGWQVTGARLASEKWQSRLVRAESWRYDRAQAAQRFAEEDAGFGRNLIRLRSGEWVPIERQVPDVDTTLGLSTIR